MNKLNSIICVFVVFFISLAISYKYIIVQNVSDIAFKNMVALSQSEGSNGRYVAYEDTKIEADPVYFPIYDDDTGWSEVIDGYFIKKTIDCIGKGIVYCEPSIEHDYWSIEDLENNDDF